MKDTVITAKRKKRELLMLLGSFIFAFLMNVYAILKYKQPLKELLTQMHVVVMLSLFIYGTMLLVRILWWLLSLLYKSIIKS